MKKLLIMILTLTLILGLSTVAFADETPNYVDASTVKITKDLESVGGVNPAETFNFTIGTGTGKRDGASIDAPAFASGTFSITVAKGAAEGTADITLPNFTQVGVYTYPITETAGSTAGFDYDGATYYLVVTVINDGEGFKRILTVYDGNDVKTDAFENTFDAGSLKIEKVITGDFAVQSDEFEVIVTLKPVAGKTLNSGAIEAIGGTTGTDNDGNYTITYIVSGGSEYTINNIPYDVDYSVVEKANDKGYTATYSNESGSIDAASTTATITNTRNADIETGINLDSLPYIIILAVAVGGLILFVTKRRMAANE